MQPFIEGSQYDTPAGRRHGLDRLARNTRGYFVAGVLNIINRARQAANRGQYGDEAWARSSLDILRWIEHCGGRFHLRGLANIGADEGPVVFISNHMSTLETLVFPCLIEPYKHVTFVVKDNLITNPFFGPVMRSRDPIVVTRNNPKEDFRIVMDKGKRMLAAGWSVIVFPQSTRTTRFEPQHFNSLGIKLARAAQAHVVPVAIKTDFWGNGRFIKDFGPLNRDLDIHMAFGPPIAIKGSGGEELQQVLAFIQEHLQAWSQPV
ncbi:MAG: lysophospholipid acyltransferase family protein [Syntrophomonas sp.]|nr:lysophospholipid acyltransferase family protein [Syntrophomonas sp.]